MSVPTARVHRQAPSSLFVKVNFDAPVFEAQGCIGVGVVIHDSIGDFLVGFSKRTPLLLDAQTT